MPGLKNLVLLLSLVLFVAEAYQAQTGEATLVLKVTDQFGDAITNAEIVLGAVGEKERRIRTDRLGFAQFLKIPAGKYGILIIAAGFNEFKIESLALGPGDERKIDALLEVAPIESKVDVGETEDADPEKPGATVVLGEREIANLPDNQEDFERSLRRLGEIMTGENLPISVNGVEGGQIPPKDSIQQIRINQNVFSAQYESPYGGGIEIFTRSNVTRFRGWISFSFADSIFNTANPFLGRREPFQSRTYFGSFSGPLFGQKANFFLYAGHSETDASAVVNAVVLDQSLNPAEFKQTLATPSRSESLNITVNADPSKKHKLYFNYNLGTARSEGQNVGGFSLPSRANETDSRNHNLQFSDTYLVSSSLVNQSRFLLGYTKNESFGGSNETAINVLDAFFGGGSQQNSTNKSLRFDVSNDTTWQRDRYSLGFGFRLRRQNIDQRSLANFGGTFTFAGRIAPVLDENNMPVTGDDGEIVSTQISSLESYRRTLLFRQVGFSPQQIRALGGGANQFTISGGDPDINVTQYEVGVYLQNSYKVSETVAASFGVRYENQTNIGSNFDIAPRFGLIWTPKAKPKQNPLSSLPRISVGYGLFYSRYALNNTLSIRQASDPSRLQFLVTETNFLDLFPNVPSVDLLQQFSLPRSQRFIDPAFETPYQSLFNLSATKKISKGYSLSFTYSRGRTRRQAFTQNINAPLAGTFDPEDPSSAIRPFGNVGNIYESRSVGTSDTDRISIALSFPQSEKLYANLRYSYNSSKSSVVTGSGSPFDPFDFSRDYGPSGFDGVHSLGGLFFYNLLKQKVTLSGDFSVNSGSRFNITTGRDTNGDGFFSERPSFATDLSKPGVVSTKYGVFDPNPLPGGELIPINLGRGPVNVIFNAAIYKGFGFNEDKVNKKPPRQTLGFNVRANNLLNIVNKANPIGNMASPNFLKSLTGFSDGGIITINGARQVNFPGRSVTFGVSYGF